MIAKARRRPNLRSAARRRLRAAKGPMLKATAPMLGYASDSMSWVRQRFLNSSTSQTVHWVLDTPNWVQSRRLQELSRHFANLKFKPMMAAEFRRLWERGGLKGKPIYFGTWRILRELVEQDLCSFGPGDYDSFMASVTSHQNIGGGLNVSTAVPPHRDPEKALESAVELLRRLRVVTVNSRILYDLLSAHIPGLIYAPNGVDERFFHPPPSRPYDPASIRVGWVGKIRAAKNHETAKAALDRLQTRGFVPCMVAHPKGQRESKLLSPSEMRSFYQDLDYYLCTSWHEGTPNPALEAAACGVPIVTTRVGNMPELVNEGENGFFVQPNLGSIVSTFLQLRELDAGAYANLGRNIRRKIEEDWTWEKNVSNYRPAFKRLLTADISVGQ